MPDIAANNFLQTMPVYDARKAVGMFKDEYLLDYINVEEIEVSKADDVDERVVEQAIVEYVIRDYNSPMGVATYKTAADMDEKVRRSLPDMEDMRRLLNDNPEIE